MNDRRLRPFTLIGVLLLSFSVTAETGPPTPGTSFRDCSYCPQMVVVPAGSFIMGSTPADNGHTEAESPLRLVKLPRPFAIGRTEVSQVQWAAIMRENPSHFNDCGADCPVEQVSWDDVQEYLSRLSAKTGRHYRLPSEAEWEYACRAGGNQAYCGGNDSSRVAWVGENSSRMSQPGGRKPANAWGLHDMSGNVFEWVADCWNPHYGGAPTDGSAWLEGNCGQRVLRGGAWYGDRLFARATARFGIGSGARNSIVGFRVARILP